MKYAILVYESADQFAAREDDRGQSYWAAHTAYSAMLGAAVRGGACLAGPATATTVRVRSGARQLVDGPFAETKEQLGGLYVVEAESLDQALAWAARCPSVTEASVEVRPLIAM